MGQNFLMAGRWLGNGALIIVAHCNILYHQQMHHTLHPHNAYTKASQSKHQETQQQAYFTADTLLLLPIYPCWY